LLSGAVARAEIGVAILAVRTLVVHDLDLGKRPTASASRRTPPALTPPACASATTAPTHERVVTLNEVAAAMAKLPTLLGSTSGLETWPWPRVELARILDRSGHHVGGGADWNLRRLHQVSGCPAVPPLPRARLSARSATDGPPAGVAARTASSTPPTRPRASLDQRFPRDRLGAILGSTAAADIPFACWPSSRWPED
jgi:hypothetical protein